MRQQIKIVSSFPLLFKGETIDFGRLQFLAYVYTAWHLDNLLVLINKKEYTRGAIIVVPQANIKNKSRFRLNEEHFNGKIFSNFSIFRIEDPFCKPNYYFYLKKLFIKSNSNNHIDIINPGGVNFKMLSQIPLEREKIYYYIIDEGMGSYMTPRMFSRAIYRKDAQNNYFKEDIKKFASSLIKKLLLRIANVKVTRQLLFKEVDVKLIPNSGVCEGLRNLYLKESIKDDENKYIIFFKDFGVIDVNPLKDYYKDLFKVFETNNYKVIVKKHPNDIDQSLENILVQFKNTQVIQNNISGERIVGEIKPELIIGGFSTAVFTSCFIYNIKTVSFMLKYKEYGELSKGHHNIINSFYKRFKNTSNNLVFVSDIEKINQIIE